jgi:hypothetical protein
LEEVFVHGKIALLDFGRRRAGPWLRRRGGREALAGVTRDGAWAVQRVEAQLVPAGEHGVRCHETPRCEICQ